MGRCWRWQKEEEEKEERLVSFHLLGSLARPLPSVSRDNADKFAGRSSKMMRRRRSKRKRKPSWLKKQPPLLMRQQIHHQLSPWRTTGAVSQLQARRRKARRERLLNQSLYLSLNQSLNRQPRNRSQSPQLQHQKLQQTTCGDSPRQRSRRKARKARSVTFFYSCSSRFLVFGVCLTATWCDYPGKRARWWLTLALRFALHTASNPNVSLCARGAHATPLESVMRASRYIGEAASRC